MMWRMRTTSFKLLALALLAIVTITLNVRADGHENPEDEPLPKTVTKITIPSALKPVQGDVTGNMSVVTLTNAGHYQFRMLSHDTYQVVIEFPWGYNFQLSRGDLWRFTLPRNYQPCQVYFIKSPHLTEWMKR
jgi:hypothetical protein